MRYYVVDAFTDRVFGGNPAGICVPETALDGAVMQQIAAENNLSETAFIRQREPGCYDLRWFTPMTEIDLCGHATLGSAYIISRFVEPGADGMRFETRSGTLSVRREGDLYIMDFPARESAPAAVTPEMSTAVGAPVREAYTAGRDLLLVVENERQVEALAPDMARIGRLAAHGVAVTARGHTGADAADFVSRFFAPNMGVPEDPVTGSAHTALIPFWAARLGKSKLTARQLSRRGGTLYGENRGDRVMIAGRAALYLRGEIIMEGYQGRL